MDTTISLSAVYGNRKEATKGDTVVGLCYRPPRLDEKVNKTFLKKNGVSPLNVGPDSHGGWELEPLRHLLNGYHSREQANNNIAGVYGGQVCASGPG